MSEGPNQRELLSHIEVLEILDKMEGESPIVVGGQSINVWAKHYEARHPLLGVTSHFASEDVDIFDNMSAAKKLAEALGDGRIILPKIDDHTPNSAVVIGRLRERKVTIDFMADVLGVERSSVLRRFVAIDGRLDGRRDISILLMNPIDCIASRLANTNVLKRHDAHSLRQAEASIAIGGLFIEDLIVDGRLKYAQQLLSGLEHMIRAGHVGKDSHIRFGKRLNPKSVMQAHLDDERFEERWRDKILKRAFERVVAKEETSMARHAAKKTARDTQAKGPAGR